MRNRRAYPANCINRNRAKRQGYPLDRMKRFKWTNRSKKNTYSICTYSNSEALNDTFPWDPPLSIRAPQRNTRSTENPLLCHIDEGDILSKQTEQDFSTTFALLISLEMTATDMYLLQMMTMISRYRYRCMDTVNPPIYPWVRYDSMKIESYLRKASNSNISWFWKCEKIFRKWKMWCNRSDTWSLIREADIGGVEYFAQKTERNLSYLSSQRDSPME